MIAFHCPHCEQEIQVRDDAAGRAGKCTRCKKPIRVPEPGTPADVTTEDDDRKPCPHCQHLLRVPADAVGRVAKCPKCEHRVRFTENGMEPVTEETPAEAPEQQQPAAQPAKEPAPEAAPTATQAAAPEWHVHTQLGQRHGPMNEAELKTLVSNRRLTAQCLVWRVGWEDWQVAGNVFPELQAGVSAAPTADPDGFLADLGEPAPTIGPQVQADQPEFTLTASKPQPAAATGTADLSGDRRLIAAISGTRPWAILFAVAAFVLATLIVVGLIFALSQAGRMSAGLVPGVVVAFLQAGVYVGTGILALMYNARIGAFIKSGSQARLTAALEAQRRFWAVLSIGLTVAMLFTIYVLIRIIQFVNALVEVPSSV